MGYISGHLGTWVYNLSFIKPPQCGVKSKITSTASPLFCCLVIKVQDLICLENLVLLPMCLTYCFEWESCRCPGTGEGSSNVAGPRPWCYLGRACCLWLSRTSLTHWSLKVPTREQAKQSSSQESLPSDFLLHPVMGRLRTVPLVVPVLQGFHLSSSLYLCIQSSISTNQFKVHGDWAGADAKAVIGWTQAPIPRLRLLVRFVFHNSLFPQSELFSRRSFVPPNKLREAQATHQFLRPVQTCLRLRRWHTGSNWYSPSTASHSDCCLQKWDHAIVHRLYLAF